MTKKDHHSTSHTQPDAASADVQQPSTDTQLSQLQQELEQLRQAQQDSLAQSQRALADYANLKKRFDKERLEIGSYVTESLVTQLLPSIDNLDRAVQYATSDEQKSALFQGLTMTLDQLHQVFADLGVTKIEVEAGQDFDPHHHEAVDTAAGTQGKIVAQLQPGYRLNTRVIRPAQVTVGDGQTTH